MESYALREIGAISRIIQTFNDIKFKPYNLQKGQFVFLTRICENKGINQIDLTNMLKVDKTTTTKVIQKMVETGFVKKTRDTTDKRMWRLYPTQKALNLYDLITEEEIRNIAICYYDFTDDERKLAYDLVRRMKENLENEWKMVKNY